MSDAPQIRETKASDDVTVFTVFDATSHRWTTTIVGGAIDGWSATYRDDDDPEAQHTKAIELARKAASDG